MEERIGNPDLFTGRKEELAYFLKWINDIKERKSQSTAMLARRKMGKTALMERLFNITFYKDNGVEYAVRHNHVDILWETVREAPKAIAYSQDEFIVQMIDEFQFL